MNYDLEMQKQMEGLPEGTKLLLHACCAPCSSAVLERLASFFEVTIFYYNPNITDETEYQKRIVEIQKLISMIHPKYPVSLLEGRYQPEEFFEMAKGLEEEPERGARCYKCYQLRLEETAKVAEKKGFPFFCTTLTLSPHKNAFWINEIGERLNDCYSPTYLYSDFKKKEGYNLYRQDYCGCIYSIRDKKEE